MTSETLEEQLKSSYERAINEFISVHGDEFNYKGIKDFMRDNLNDTNYYLWEDNLEEYGEILKGE